MSVHVSPPTPHASIIIHFHTLLLGPRQEQHLAHPLVPPTAQGDRQDYYITFPAPRLGVI